jgi:hypothetical protein
MDTSNSFFPMDMNMQTDNFGGGLSGPQNPQQNNANAFAGNGMANGGPFMGVSTPPRNNFP